METRIPSGRARKRASVCRGAGAEEVRVAQRRPVRDRVDVDPERVLEVGADVRVGMVHRGRALDAWDGCDLRFESPLGGDAGRRGGGDVGAERQLRVDVGLLVVGGGEDAELDAEREQQPDHDEPAVDRLAAAPRAREHERARAPRRTRSCAVGGPRERPSAEADEQQRCADPQQRRGEEHVRGKRQGRVRVRVDDRREPGSSCQPPDQPARRQRDRRRRTAAATAACPRAGRRGGCR